MIPEQLRYDKSPGNAGISGGVLHSANSGNLYTIKTLQLPDNLKAQIGRGLGGSHVLRSTMHEHHPHHIVHTSRGSPTLYDTHPRTSPGSNTRIISQYAHVLN